jgi:hypothetical protein
MGDAALGKDLEQAIFAGSRLAVEGRLVGHSLSGFYFCKP